MLVDKYTTDRRYNELKFQLQYKIESLKKINSCLNAENQQLRERTYRLNKQIVQLQESKEKNPLLTKVKKNNCVIM